MKVLAIVVVLAAVSCCYGDTVVLNQAVDQLLEGLKEQIATQGKDIVPIPDISGDWHWRKAFVKISGNLNCHGNGKAGHLTSLHRTGDVTLTTTPSTVTLQAKLGLSDLYFGYDTCQVKVHRLFSASHRLEASVDGSSIEAQITLTHNGNSCVARLDHIGLTDMGKVKIRLGGSVFQKFLDKVLDILVDKWRSKFSKVINEQLTKAITAQLLKTDLCKKIPH